MAVLPLKAFLPDMDYEGERDSALTTRENLEQNGAEALSVALPFDEAAVLRDNLQYLFNTLDLDSITVKYTDAPDAPEKSREDCAPGRPHLSLLASPAVTLALANPAPRSGLFSVAVRVANYDTLAKLKAKLAKEVKAVKELNKLKIWRYKDPVLGPRKIPVADDYLTKCETLSDAAVFNIDVDNQIVHAVDGGKTVDVGVHLLYTYDA